MHVTNGNAGFNDLATSERTEPKLATGLVTRHDVKPAIPKGLRASSFYQGKRMEPCAVDRNQIPIHPRDEGRDRDTNNHNDEGFKHDAPTVLDGQPSEYRETPSMNGEPHAPNSMGNAVNRIDSSTLT